MDRRSLHAANVLEDELLDQLTLLHSRLEGSISEWPRAADVERVSASLTRLRALDTTRADVLNTRLNGLVGDLTRRYETTITGLTETIGAATEFAPNQANLVE